MPGDEFQKQDTAVHLGLSEFGFALSVVHGEISLGGAGENEWFNINMYVKICEIFRSIQGESIDAGLPCVFVRLSGCNLRCRYCDTRYAWEDGSPLSVTEILRRVAAFNCKMVEVTGGEPLLQPETPQLINRLLKAGYQVLLETNGSFDIDRVSRNCVRIVDIKCPGSGETGRMDMANLERLHGRDQVKFVISDRADFDFAASLVQLQIRNRIPGGQILFSPALGKLAPDMLANWLVESGLTARFQIQLHKIIWPDIDRGV